MIIAHMQKRPLLPLPKIAGGIFTEDELKMNLFDAGLANNGV